MTFKKGQIPWNKDKHHSEETKKKLSEAQKGKHLSFETKKKISEANKGKTIWITGKHHSDETKRKMSKAKIGKKKSEETKKKMSEAKKGREVSPETRKKISEARSGISKNKDYQRDYLRNKRNAVLEALGGKCMKCGFEDKRALQIDHVNGGGSKERKEKGFNSDFHSHVLKSFLNKENKYQLLCANCNWIKRFENNETKYKKNKINLYI